MADNNEALAQETAETKGKFTILDGWAIGSGSMIGVTIFVVCGTVSGLAGPAGSLGFLIAGLLVMCVALCCCEILSAVPDSGGAYLFPRRAIKGEAGSFLSFISGWALWGGQGLAPAVVTVATVSYLSAFINLITGGDLQLNVPITASILTVLYFIANWFGGSGGRALQLATTFIVVGVLLIFIIWGGMNVKPELLDPFVQGDPGGALGIMTAVTMAILGFGGWSAIPNMSGEFKNPVRDVPIATLLSLLTCAVLFTIFTFVMNGLLPGAELAASSSPPVDAMNTFTSAGALIISLGGLAACVSTSNGLMMTGSRMPFAMGRDGDLPRVFEKTNKAGIPSTALIFTALGQLFLCWTGSALTTLVSLAVAVTAVSWVLTVISSIMARRNGLVAPFRVPAFYLIAIIAIAGLVIIFVRLAQTNQIGIMMTCIWLVIGVVVYFLFNKTSLKKNCNTKQQYELLGSETSK